jgi:hypothetical protein
MAIFWKSQEKDTLIGTYFSDTCFYKANKAIVAKIYQFLRFIQTQISYQQLVL